MITKEEIKQYLLCEKSTYDEKEMRSLIRDGIEKYEITVEEIYRFLELYHLGALSSLYSFRNTLELIAYILIDSKLYKNAKGEIKEALQLLLSYSGDPDLYYDEADFLYRTFYNLDKKYEDKLYLPHEYLSHVHRYLKKEDVNDEDINNLNFAFKRLLEKKNAEGIYLLGHLCNVGCPKYKIEIDYHKAIKYLLHAAKLGYTYAYSELGFIYLDKRLKSKNNDEKAYLYLTKATLSGDYYDAYAGLAMLYKEGRFVKKDVKTSILLMKRTLPKVLEKVAKLEDQFINYPLFIITYIKCVILEENKIYLPDVHNIIDCYYYIIRKQALENNHQYDCYLTQIRKYIQSSDFIKEKGFYGEIDYPRYKDLNKGDYVCFALKNLYLRGKVKEFKFSPEKIDLNDKLNNYILLEDVDWERFRSTESWDEKFCNYIRFTLDGKYLLIYKDLAKNNNVYLEKEFFISKGEVEEGYKQVTSYDELIELSLEHLSQDDITIERSGRETITFIVHNHFKKETITLKLYGVVESTVTDYTELNSSIRTGSFFLDFYTKNLILEDDLLNRHKTIFSYLGYKIEKAEE